MHIRRGLPFTSALQEPHLPALQFQRTARSAACVAWMVWMTSRTTCPSSALDRRSRRTCRRLACRRRKSRAWLRFSDSSVTSPRRTWPALPASAAAAERSIDIAPCGFLADRDVVLAPFRVGLREVVAGVGAAALLRISAARAIASETVSSESQVHREVPAGVVLAGCPRRWCASARSLYSASLASAAFSSASLRMMPTRVCIISCSSRWIVYGFSAPSRSKWPNMSAATSSMSPLSDLWLRRLRPLAYSAAPRPARRPKTRRSDSELPPSRLAPCMPPAHSPAAKRPGTVAAPVSASTRTPPMM